MGNILYFPETHLSCASLVLRRSMKYIHQDNTMTYNEEENQQKRYI